MQQARIRICSIVVGDHFGQIPQKIFEVLATQGALSLRELLSRFPEELTIQKALQTLIHHQLIREYPTTRSKSDSHKKNQNPKKKSSSKEDTLKGSSNTAINENNNTSARLDINDPNKTLILYECDIDTVEMMLIGSHCVRLIQEKETNISRHFISQNTGSSFEGCLEGCYVILKLMIENGRVTMQCIYDLFAQHISGIIQHILNHQSFNLLFANNKDKEKGTNKNKNKNENSDKFKYENMMEIDNGGISEEEKSEKQKQKQTYEQSYGPWVRYIVTVYQYSLQQPNTSSYEQQLIKQFRQCWEWLLKEQYIMICHANDRYNITVENELGGLIGLKRKLDTPSKGVPPRKKQRLLTGSSSNKEEKINEEDISDNENISMDVEKKKESENEVHDKQYIICYRTFLQEMRKDLLLEYTSEQFDHGIRSIHYATIQIILENALQQLKSKYPKKLTDPANMAPIIQLEHEIQSFNLSTNSNINKLKSGKEDKAAKNIKSAISNRYSIGISTYSKDLQKYDEIEENDLKFSMNKQQIEQELYRRNFSSKNLEKVLEELTDGYDLCFEMRDVTPLLLPIKNEYYVNVRGIIDRLRLMDAQTLIHSRLGVECARVFKAIMDFRYIGERQLGDICMMNLTDARKCLYSMLTENFVEMQEIPRTPDRDPYRTYYTWCISWTSLHEKLLISMYNGLGNLLQRKIEIRNKSKELEKQLSNNNNNNNNNNNTGSTLNEQTQDSFERGNSGTGKKELLKQYKMLKNALLRINVAVSKMVHQIMLHRDF